MMTENLIYFQHRTGASRDWLVNATEFRTFGGNKYSVTIINEKGHVSLNPGTREEAIEAANNEIRRMLSKLHDIYGLYGL